MMREMREAWETYQQFGPYVRFWVLFGVLYTIAIGGTLFWRAVT